MYTGSPWKYRIHQPLRRSTFCRTHRTYERSYERVPYASVWGTRTHLSGRDRVAPSNERRFTTTNGESFARSSISQWRLAAASDEQVRHRPPARPTTLYQCRVARRRTCPILPMYVDGVLPPPTGSVVGCACAVTGRRRGAKRRAITTAAWSNLPTDEMLNDDDTSGQ